MRLEHARKIAADVVLKLRPYVEEIEVAGSVRRCKPIVGDIEVVVIPKSTPQHDLLGVEIGAMRDPGFARVISQWKKVKGDASTGKYTQRILNLDYPSIDEKEFKLDIFTATRDNWGYILAIRTGSENFSKRFAKQWVDKGFHGDAGMLCDADNNPIKTPTEEEFFKIIGMPFVPPHKRI